MVHSMENEMAATEQEFLRELGRLLSPEQNRQLAQKMFEAMVPSAVEVLGELGAKSTNKRDRSAIRNSLQKIANSQHEQAKRAQELLTKIS